MYEQTTKHQPRTPTKVVIHQGAFFVVGVLCLFLVAKQIPHKDNKTNKKKTKKQRNKTKQRQRSSRCYINTYKCTYTLEEGPEA
jgi:zinc transporter ZupT